MQPTFQNLLHYPVPAEMGAVGAPDGDNQVRLGGPRLEIAVVARADRLSREFHRRRVGVDPREEVRDAHRAESPAFRIRDATPHRGVSPVAVRLRRIQSDEHHARPNRPAVIPIVAVESARTEDGMVGKGGQECGGKHGKRDCRMLDDADGEFRDEVWGRNLSIFLQREESSQKDRSHTWSSRCMGDSEK